MAHRPKHKDYEITPTSRSWDKRIRKICDLPNKISVWTVSLWGYEPPEYSYERYGTCIAVFRGEELESAVTNYHNQIDSSIYHMAMSDAKRYSRNPSRGLIG